MQQLSVSFWQGGWAGLSVETVVFYPRFLPPDKEQSTHSTLEPSHLSDQFTQLQAVTSSSEKDSWLGPSSPSNCKKK